MTYRVGQKVVCVVESTRWVISGAYVRPEKDAIYTVRSIVPADQSGGECFRLVEIVNPSISVGGEPGYLVTGFRPAVDKKTDIDFAHEILRKVSKTKETAA